MHYETIERLSAPPSRLTGARVSPPTAFVLGGGGLLGAVEVGMLRALFEAGVSPDLVLGTSVGALNGALVAADPAPGVIERLSELWESAARARRCTATERSVSVAGPSGPAPTCTPRAAAQPAAEELGDLTFAELRGAVPVLRGEHRAGRRALVHPGPGRRRGGRVAPRCRGCCAPAEVDGEHYLDGGIVNSIPVGRAVGCGADRIFVLQVGRVDRPLGRAPPAVGGRPGLVRDRPAAPVPPGDGRAARARRRRTCCRPAAASAQRRLAAGLPRLRRRTRRIDAALRRHAAYLAEHL